MQLAMGPDRKPTYREALEAKLRNPNHKKHVLNVAYDELSKRKVAVEPSDLAYAVREMRQAGLKDHARKLLEMYGSFRVYNLEQLKKAGIPLETICSRFEANGADYGHMIYGHIIEIQPAPIFTKPNVKERLHIGESIVYVDGQKYGTIATPKEQPKSL